MIIKPEGWFVTVHCEGEHQNTIRWAHCPNSTVEQAFRTGLNLRVPGRESWITLREDKTAPLKPVTP